MPKSQSWAPQDPDAMDVDAVHIEKMTPTEQKEVHWQCNTFSSTPNVANVEEMEEVIDEDELMIAKVSI